MPAHSALKTRVKRAYVAGIHDFLPCKKDVDGRDTSAFTRVFDALCPAMTGRRVIFQNRSLFKMTP
jgi:hypothetical protein